MPQPKVISFNVLLSQDDVTKLLQLKAATGRSRAQLIREGISAIHRMQILNVPTCASGQPCYVPHMHPAVTEQGARHGT